MKNTWNIGQARADITCFIEDVVMLGYSNPHNKIRSIETPVMARAFFFEAGRECFLYINLETCFITESLITGLMDKMSEHPELSKLARKDIMMAAQHTHANAGGFLKYCFYNMPTPGHVPKILKVIVEQTYKAVCEAYENRQSSEVCLKQGAFELDQDISFNRSLKAYNKNPEVRALKKHPGERGAVNNKMHVLEVINQEKETAGLISWFAVHATSLAPDNTAICPDNKGYAAIFMEEYLKKDDTSAVAIFAQGDAGDVSPNYIYDSEQNRRRGRFKDQFESAQHNGKLQFEKVIEIQNSCGIKLEAELDSELIYVDFPKIQIADKYLPKKYKKKRLTPATGSLGVAFLKGTIEGPGIGWFLSTFLETICFLAKTCNRIFYPTKFREYRDYYRSQGKKAVVADGGRHTIMGVKKITRLPVPGFIDPVWAMTRKTYRDGAMEEHTWFQEVLPIQITILGKLALIAVPAEPTTIAGQRLRATALGVLKKRGVEEVLISSYANSYSGYITTPEEYQAQCYEGGHTLFGRWTLPAYQTIVEKMANEMLKPNEQRDLDRQTRPPEFSKEELSRRTYIN